MYEYVNILSKLGMPIYWIIHESQRNYYFELYNNDELRSAFFNGTHIIYQSSSVQNIYRDIPQKSLIIPNGVNLNEMEEKSNKNIFDRNKYGISSKDIVICILGQIQKRKRQIIFIMSIFSKLIVNYKDVKLLLVGPFIEDTKELFDKNIYPELKKYIIHMGKS